MIKTHRWRGVSLVMALTMVIGFALPALGDNERPFRGYADEEVISRVQDDVDGTTHVIATGEGQATHLGHFTRLGRVVIDSEGNAEGTVVFTAANGDELHADIEGVPTGVPGTLAGTYTFTGGTGRFSDASGVVPFVGITSDFIHIAVVFEGTIQY